MFCWRVLQLSETKRGWVQQISRHISQPNTFLIHKTDKHSLKILECIRRHTQIAWIDYCIANWKYLYTLEYQLLISVTWSSMNLEVVKDTGLDSQTPYFLEGVHWSWSLKSGNSLCRVAQGTAKFCCISYSTLGLAQSAQEKWKFYPLLLRIAQQGVPTFRSCYRGRVQLGEDDLLLQFLFLELSSNPLSLVKYYPQVKVTLNFDAVIVVFNYR